MALLGSPPIIKQVGIRLLSCSVDTGAVARAAGCAVGIALPVYSTFKAIEKKGPDEQEKWLLYWAAYGSFRLVEVYSDEFLSWFPLYHYLKFAVLIWLQFPSNNGARHLYVRYLRPLLLKHQARLDQLHGYVSGEIASFISAHQEEIHYLRALFWRCVLKVSKMLKCVIDLVQHRRRNATEGPNRPATPQNRDSHSGHAS